MRRRAAALFALLLGGACAWAPALGAGQSATPNRFGAIAYHAPSKSWGVGYDFARARDANVEALRQCANPRCEVVHRFKNGCAALADGGKPAAASGATRDEAETKALKRCAAAGCAVVAWGCTR